MTGPEKDGIRQFISTHAGGLQIDDADDLFASGYVNSLFAVQLVMWLERTFELNVDSGDLDFANFRSIVAIAEFVNRKRATSNSNVPSHAPGGTSGLQLDGRAKSTA